MSIEKIAGVVAVLLGLMTYIALLGVVEDITVPVSNRQASLFDVFCRDCGIHSHPCSLQVGES